MPSKSEEDSAPLWLWPNLLSLDAPLVAVLWQGFLAYRFSLPLRPSGRLALGLTVWAIYLLDRLLDARKPPSVNGCDEPARHRYYRRRFKPMAALLLAENCTVTLAHSRTRDLPAVLRRADILVAAVGQPELVRGSWIREGAVVIDVGINRIAGSEEKSRLVGDVAFAEAQGIAGAITPVPGGVGPMTIACLLRNTLIAACRRRGHPEPQI